MEQYKNKINLLSTLCCSLSWKIEKFRIIDNMQIFTYNICEYMPVIRERMPFLRLLYFAVIVHLTSGHTRAAIHRGHVHKQKMLFLLDI